MKSTFHNNGSEIEKKTRRCSARERKRLNELTNNKKTREINGPSKAG